MVGPPVRFTAVRPSVAVRSGPAATAEPLAQLEEGDEIAAADVFIEEGIEWVRLSRGAKVTRTTAVGGKVPLGLAQDGYVPTEDPVEGTLLRKQHLQVAVAQRAEEGVLSKAEIQEVLDKSSDPSIALPLEARFWSRQQLEMFVLSSGTIRPKICSMPDERLMENTDMSPDQIARALGQAAEWLASADVLLIGSGAGMGVDSGLGTFRGGHRGVWQGLEAVGLAYEEICDPRWFAEEPHLAWAFWDHCHKAYQETVPHEGYARARAWGARCPLGFFSFTSNIDGHWVTSGTGADRVLEVHGAVRWLQCSKPCCPDVWKAPKQLGLTPLATHRVSGILPTCPKCKAVARPNVQMFGGDAGFSKARRAAQFAKYDAWLKQLEARPDKANLRVVCLEVGCGLTVPTVRRELEDVVQKFPKARLIRINPENPGLSKELAPCGISLPLPAGPALRELEQRASAATQEVTYVLWGRSGAVELLAPFGVTLGRLLRLAEKEVKDEGISVEFKGDAKGCCILPTGKVDAFLIDNPVPAQCFAEMKEPGGSSLRMLASLEVEAFFRDASGEPVGSARLKRRIEEVSAMLDDVNARFEQESYQQQVRACLDRQSVLQAVRAVQHEVLPKYGIEASERGSVALGQLTSLVQRLPEISEKAERSMDLSYVKHMSSLPVKAPVAAAPSVCRPSKDAGPVQVTLVTYVGGGTIGEIEDRLQVQLPAQASIGELRIRVAEQLGWKDDSAAEFFQLPPDTREGPARTLRDSDTVRNEMLVRNARLRRPAETVEVTFVEMAEEGGPKARSVKLEVSTWDTVADLRGRLSEELGWDAAARARARLLVRSGAAYGGLRDEERVEGRRALFVRGAPLERPAAAAEGRRTNNPSGGGNGKGVGGVAGVRAEVSAALAEARRAAATAEAAAPARGAWTRWPHCDLQAKNAEEMQADDLEAVRRRVEVRGYSGFSLWKGTAYLKKVDRPLARKDLVFKGNGDLVEFHIFARSPAFAGGLSLAAGLALQAELMGGFAGEEFQSQLAEALRRLAGDKNEKRFSMAKAMIIHKAQRLVLPRYGFPASQMGALEMLAAFSTPDLQASAAQRANSTQIDFLLDGRLCLALASGGRLQDEYTTYGPDGTAQDQLKISLGSAPGTFALRTRDGDTAAELDGPTLRPRAGGDGDAAGGMTGSVAADGAIDWGNGWRSVPKAPPLSGAAAVAGG